MTRYLGKSHEEMKKIERIYLDIQINSPEEAYKMLKEYGPDFTDADNQIHEEFRERLQNLWGYGFQGMELIVQASIFYGSGYNSVFSKRADKDIKFAVLTHLHSRACQICNEMLVLLKNGLPDAAIARWRTLYEVTVCMKFISMNDSILSQKYLDYSFVISLEKMKRYNALGGGNPIDRYPNERIDEQEKKVRQLCEKYGPGFKGKNAGWAYKEINDLQNGEGGFSGMEKAVGWGEQHLYYLVASGGVHHGVDGTFQRLCMMKGVRDVVPVGGSNYGLSTPGMLMMRTIIEANMIMFSQHVGITDEEKEFLRRINDIIEALKTIAVETEEALYSLTLTPDPLVFTAF